MGGIVGRVLQILKITKRGATVPEIKAEVRKGQIKRMERFNPPGDDSNPLPDDLVFSVSRPETGIWAALGYIDQDNAPVALAGEKRFYARDTSGNIKSTIWMQNDGKVTIWNDNAMVTIAADGKVTIDSSVNTEINSAATVINNNVTINGTLQVNGSAQATGTVTGDTDVLTGATSLKNHTHPQGIDSGLDTQANTGAPL